MRSPAVPRGSRPASRNTPRPCGIGSAASSASGVSTIAPSILCHGEAITFVSTYSARPRRHISTNTPQRFRARKCSCAELALPHSRGRAFHWQPSCRLRTMAPDSGRPSVSGPSGPSPVLAALDPSVLGYQRRHTFAQGVGHSPRSDECQPSYQTAASVRESSADKLSGAGCRIGKRDVHVARLPAILRTLLQW